MRGSSVWIQFAALVAMLLCLPAVVYGVLMLGSRWATAVSVDSIYQLDPTPADLVYQIDRKLDALADMFASAPPDVVKGQLGTVSWQVGNRPDMVAAIAQRRFPNHPAVLSLISDNRLTSRAVPPPDELWPTDPAMLFDLLMGGYRYDMGQYLANVPVTAAQLESIAPFLENRNIRVLLTMFMNAGRSKEIAKLLEIPSFGDELLRHRVGPAMALEAMNRGDQEAFSALVGHKSASKWINFKFDGWADDTLLIIAARNGEEWAVRRLCEVSAVDLRAVNIDYEEAIDVVDPDSDLCAILLEAIIDRHRQWVSSRRRQAASRQSPAEISPALLQTRTR